MTGIAIKMSAVVWNAVDMNTHTVKAVVFVLATLHFTS